MRHGVDEPPTLLGPARGGGVPPERVQVDLVRRLHVEVVELPLVPDEDPPTLLALGFDHRAECMNDYVQTVYSRLFVRTGPQALHQRLSGNRVAGLEHQQLEQRECLLALERRVGDPPLTKPDRERAEAPELEHRAGTVPHPRPGRSGPYRQLGGRA